MSIWYYLLSGFFLLDTMQAFGFIDRLVYGPFSPGSDLVTQSLNLLMIGASFMLFSRGCYRGGFRGLVPGSVLALSAIGFLWLSSLWSLEPATSSRVAFIYLYVILGAIGVACTMRADEFMNLLSWSCFMAAIVSLFMAIAFPAIGFAGSIDGLDFRGIFTHKNVLGQVMATGALATLHSIRVARRGYLGKLCVLFVLVGMAYASKSTGAFMVSLVFCGISGIDSLWRRGGAARMTGAVLAAFLGLVVIGAVIAPDTLLVLIGKDPTLTGRTVIWAYVIQDIWIKPWLGWGYYGFWTMSNPAAVEVSDAMGFVVPHAHNGLLEGLLSVGVLGTALFVFILIRNIVMAIRCLRTPERALGVSTISCCVGILQIGVSETVLLAPTEALTPLMFIAGLMCERALYAAEGRRYRAADSRGKSSVVLPDSRGQLRARA
jgi:exopolysaccharide production protein ExoQ